jgi:hypothetical protein
MLFHFRIATHGGVKPALCHPFPLSRKIPNLKRLYAQTNLAIVHNGVIPIEPKGDISDTMEYIRTNLVDRSNRNFEFYRSKRQRKAILAEINSKMAFLDCNGNVYMVGEFIEDNGIMYSNSSYKERTFSFSIFDDYTSFKMLCPVDEGYIVSGGKMTECEFGQYYIDRQGRVYEYEYVFDVAFRIHGSAYNVNGMSALFDEDYIRKIGNSSSKYRQPIWNCSTYLNKGKSVCYAKQIPEDILYQITCEVLGISKFDEQIFKAKIKEMTVPEWNVVTFVFHDGTKITKTWEDKSRKWTDEMKAENYENLRRHKR